LTIKALTASTNQRYLQQRETNEFKKIRKVIQEVYQTNNGPPPRLALTNQETSLTLSAVTAGVPHLNLPLASKLQHN
jgi:hypothetical protein